MKLFLWTGKLLFLITQIFFCISMRHHELYIDLSLDRSGRSYYELINVWNIIKWAAEITLFLASILQQVNRILVKLGLK